MTIDSFLDLANKSWPAATLIILGLVVWRLSYVLWPYVTRLLEAAIAFFLSGIQANEKNAEAIQHQTPTLLRIDTTVEHIDRVQSDPQSMVSNVDTLRHLRASLSNDVLLAKAAEQALDALLEHQPQLRDRLQPALDTLSRITANN